MFKILVPTDFSPVAHNAALFALEVAGQMDNVEITFFHCIEVSDIGERLASQVGDLLLKEADAEMATVAGLYKNLLKPGTHSQYDIVFGNTQKEIAKKASGHQVDLIIMGTKGAGALEKFFVGSVASQIVSETTDCPVLVVPEEKAPGPVKTIVYATDMADIKSELPIVAALAKILDARLEVLNIAENRDNLKDIDPLKKSYEMAMENNYSAISFQQAYSLDVTDGIEQFAVERKADLVAMFSRRKSYFERLFDVSFTKEMAFHKHVPLLAIPYELTLK